jgi:pimeloyl-ACP methyl ester carboxylesterase
MTQPDGIETGFAPVNGLKLYYEVRGEGEPLVLLHGGVVGIIMFGSNLEALSKDRRLIAVELQGHGRTPDIDRPLSYEAMADDVAALMRHLDIPRADVIGLSLGAGVALQTASHRRGSSSSSVAGCVRACRSISRRRTPTVTQACGDPSLCEDEPAPAGR